MPGRILLDTNIVIALFNQESATQRALEGIDEVFVPVIVLGELLFGARRSQRGDANVAKIVELATATTVITCDEQTA